MKSKAYICINSLLGSSAAKFRTALITLSTLILVACGGWSQARSTGERAVTSFHTLYNQGKIQDILANADPAFRTPTVKAKYEELMQAMQTKLGQVLSSSNIAWQVQSFNMKSSVVLSQTTTFEHGQGTEAFTFITNGTNATLVQYNIQSFNLLTK